MRARATAEAWAHLVGARVVSIDYDKDCEEFNIVTDRGTMCLSAYGDCCSHSWFQAFDRHEDLIGQELLSIEERIEERADRSGDSDECEDPDGLTQLYGVVFSYAGGSAYLEMRNDSNGYYGGEIELEWFV